MASSGLTGWTTRFEGTLHIVPRIPREINHVVRGLLLLALSRQGTFRLGFVSGIS
jgi:hypothetical protein